MPLTPLSLSPPSTRSPLLHSLTSPSYIWSSFRITSPFTLMKVLSRLSMWAILFMRLAVSIANIVRRGFGGYMGFGLLRGGLGCWEGLGDGGGFGGLSGGEYTSIGY
ncbi:hypothetical protein B0T14DRAFT_500790 [Immersiella caudata]|uniref:Uncharacterized protein n=1 Tax=Immersiella caudata TaxID=314043 RepID=A0AA39WCW0_9PEZI|nr:hypothetical protein B0T14DRAFT_500790 [Immersiella caudata]